LVGLPGTAADSDEDAAEGAAALGLPKAEKTSDWPRRYWRRFFA
jgi:hypothetical protein